MTLGISIQERDSVKQ